ncbi:MAG TPA: hypothetical protein ENK27_03270 [Desulfobulbus sp.]|nr:hypothetical protein [Desulfobulbus sp.]
MLIAIASTDGETVNEHFGRADRFLIYEIAEGRRHLLLIRRVNPWSAGDGSHEFSEERFTPLAASLADCARIYCSHIGQRPRQELEQRGITVVAGTRRISEITEEENAASP